jgi:large subunit ribosomal protein L18
MKVTKSSRRLKIKRGIRSKIYGTSEKPRLTVFRSNNEIYAQIIDDLKGNTLAAASSKQKGLSLAGLTKVQVSAEVGKAIAEKAKSAGLQNVVFDRNGYLYHGRIKALAEGAREGGLIF